MNSWYYQIVFMLFWVMPFSCSDNSNNSENIKTNADSKSERKSITNNDMSNIEPKNDVKIQEPIKQENLSKQENKQDKKDWSQVANQIAEAEELINSGDFSAIERLKKIIEENPDYPNNKILIDAIKTWEQESKWAGITKEIKQIEKKINSNDYSGIETIQAILDKNPQYPLKKLTEESLQNLRKLKLWGEITKQVEWSAFFLDKSDFKDLDVIRELMKNNLDYPQKSLIDKKIKKWEHEFFLQNVPL